METDPETTNLLILTITQWPFELSVINKREGNDQKERGLENKEVDINKEWKSGPSYVTPKGPDSD